MYRQPRSAALRRRSLLLAVSFGLSACGSGLSSLDDRTVGVSFQQGDLHVSVGYNWGGEDAPGCITLREFKGSLNGMPLEVTSPGRRTGHTPFAACELPDLKLSADQFPVGIQANIRISDDSMEIKVDLPTLFAPRTTSIASQTPGAMHPGEEVVLSWTPESDFVLQGHPFCLFYSDIRGELFRSSSSLPPEACRNGSCDNHIRLIDPQHIWLRVPEPSASAGPLPIAGKLSLDSMSRAIDRCDGAKCYMRVDHLAEITMVAAPSP